MNLEISFCMIVIFSSTFGRVSPNVIQHYILLFVFPSHYNQCNMKTWALNWTRSKKNTCDDVRITLMQFTIRLIITLFILWFNIIHTIPYRHYQLKILSRLNSIKTFSSLIQYLLQNLVPPYSQHTATIPQSSPSREPSIHHKITKNYPRVWSTNPTGKSAIRIRMTPTADATERLGFARREPRFQRVHFRHKEFLGGLLLALGRLHVGQGAERSRRGTSHETVRE